jgi:hypothetical protein
MRYEMVQCRDGELRILCIEEQAYAPLRWYSVQYSCSDGRLQPEPEDLCVRSQVIAFCHSYLAHFGARIRPE